MVKTKIVKSNYITQYQKHNKKIKFINIYLFTTMSSEKQPECRKK